MAATPGQHRSSHHTAPDLPGTGTTAVTAPVTGARIEVDTREMRRSAYGIGEVGRRITAFAAAVEPVLGRKPIKRDPASAEQDESWRQFGPFLHEAVTGVVGSVLVLGAALEGTETALAELAKRHELAEENNTRTAAQVLTAAGPR
ncbi:hypothetical protein ACIGNX_22380 [Actinosynnema sp. NPDC053489]|uniref:hypothetical protein n=1 Tax=Actinosynnema sp. NPDC053489 TaxID=3363916 RepID=UPI0037C8D5ED